MTDLIRSAGLSCYPEVARSVGLDPRQMMRKVRLPLAILDKPDTPIAVPSLRRLLELSAEESGAEDFGLRLAERGGLTNFGAVGLIVREQATVGEAIEAFSRFIHIHHDGMKLDVVRDKQTVTVTLHLRGRQPTAPRQSIDMALGSVHRIIQSLFGSDWRPQEVHLHYPPPHDRKRYRDFYGCRVIFNAAAVEVAVAPVRSCGGGWWGPLLRPPVASEQQLDDAVKLAERHVDRLACAAPSAAARADAM